MDKDHAMEIKVLTLSALQYHKDKAKIKGKDCHLEYISNPGSLPQTDMMWRYPLAYAENRIQKQLMAKREESNSKKQGYQSRTSKVLDHRWVKGSDFDNKQQRF